MKKRTNNIQVVKDPVNPETPQLLAAAIISISESMKKLAGPGGLTEDAVAALVVNMRGNVGKVSKGDVLLVLDGLTRLKSYYVRNK